MTAGQPLYQIDPKPYQAAYDNAAATLAAAKAKADRYAVLVKQYAVAPQDYDDALAAYKQAAANADAARINLGYTRITAPITGIIGRSLFTEGALLTANQADPLTTIQTLDPIYVDINQSSDELVALKRALTSGQVSRDAPQSRARDADVWRRHALRASTAHLNSAKSLSIRRRGGNFRAQAFPIPMDCCCRACMCAPQSSKASIINALLAPQRGVSRDEKGQPTAMIVDGKGIVRLRVLKVARTVGSNWLVTDGLKAGDKLIVEGLQNARPEAPVHAVPAGSKPAAAPQGH